MTSSIVSVSEMYHFEVPDSARRRPYKYRRKTKYCILFFYAHNMDTKTGATSGMSGSYNSNSTPQLLFIKSSTTLIKDAIELLDINSSSFPIIVADYGSSHGSNSVYIMKFITDYIKKLNKTDRSFLIIHNDLPTNNWNSLFNVVKNGENNCFSLGNGQSFYNQCLPSNCLTIGYSSASIHWLSRRPCNISNHCISVYAKGEELEKFKSQAREDYKEFLKNRSRELISGGILILMITGVNKQGLSSMEGTYKLAYKSAKLLPLTEEELLHFTIPVYLRSYEECCDKELFDLYSFELIKSDTLNIDFQFYQKLKNGEQTLEEFAQIQKGFFRCAIDSILREALAINKNRSEEEIDQLSNQYWNIYYEQVKQNPHELDLKSHQTYIILKKI